MPRHNLTLFLVAMLSLTLAGCAVGPDYKRVEPDAPKNWNAELTGGITPGPLDPKTLAGWWSTLNDEELERLTERAAYGNLDLQEARARVREARALRGVSRAELYPTLDVEASAGKVRSSENSGTGRETELYQAGFDAGWELDIFGGVRRRVEASQAELEAEIAGLNDVLVSLMAEVALNYIDVRTFQARIAVAEANIKVQEETYHLNRAGYEAGLIDELAVQQSLYNLESTRSLIPALQTGLSEAKNRLAVLTGENPGSLAGELAAVEPIPVPPLSIAVGVPADTLRQRPDIRQAERILAAQTARVGAATAELYPSFSLSGTFGVESISTGNLFDWASRTWSFGSSALLALFRGGAIRQNIEVEDARLEQALILYRSAVLDALEEVENALVAYAKEQSRRDLLKNAVSAAQLAYELANNRYLAGLTDFNNVLDAQRALQVFQDDLAQSEGAVTSNLVRLYKALGGGWEYLASAEKSEMK
jgi:NodT family efflux transporter outer membrane factor (OMF) lipoprotein